MKTTAEENLVCANNLINKLAKFEVSRLRGSQLENILAVLCIPWHHRPLLLPPAVGNYGNAIKDYGARPRVTLMS